MKFDYRHALWCAACVCIGVCVPGSASADRRTSLQGSRLIQDGDDVFIYPHLANDYRNAVTLDYGLRNGVGSGLFLMAGERGAWGLALHRGTVFDATQLTGQLELDALGPLGSPALPPGLIAGSESPSQAVDLFLAGKSFGARITGGFGREIGNSESGIETARATRFLNLAMSLDSVDDWDIGLHLGGLNATTRELLFINERTNQFRGTAIARGYFKRKKRSRQLGVLLRTGYIFQQFDMPNTSDSTQRAGRFDIGAGFGPRVKFADRVQVAAYTIFNYQSLTITAPNGAQSSQTTMILPGFNVAAEASPREWLRVRGGMEYLFVAESIDNDAEIERYDPQMRWSGGVGFVRKEFDFNITLASNLPLDLESPTPVDPMNPLDPNAPQQEDLLGDGLAGLLGGAPSLMFSTTYRFGPSRYYPITASELAEEDAEREAEREAVRRARQERAPRQPQGSPVTPTSPQPVEPAPVTAPPVDLMPAQPDGEDEEEQKDEAREEEEPVTPRKKKDDRVLGSPPPNDNLFVPATPK